MKPLFLYLSVKVYPLTIKEVFFFLNKYSWVEGSGNANVWKITNHGPSNQKTKMPLD